MPAANTRIPETEVVKTYDLVGVLGIFRTEQNSGINEHLLFVQDGDVLGKIDGSVVYSIRRVRALQIVGDGGSEEVESVINLIESHPFYCTGAEIKECYQWNSILRRNFNKRTRKQGRRKRVSHSLFVEDKEEQETEFEKNEQNYAIFSDSDSFSLLNLFSGYYEYQTYRNGSIHYTFEIRSFVSTNKIGPRMLCRGVDEDGNAAFFVKTSFRCNSNQSKNDEPEINFTIFRGSVPLFWAQTDPLKPSKIWFEGTEKENSGAFRKHMDQMKQKNEDVVVIDLLGHSKYEAILSQMYREKCCKQKIKYINFHLNAHINDYENMKRLLYDKIHRIGADDNGCILDEETSAESEISAFETETLASYSLLEESECFSNTPQIDQNRVYRVNCLDCLDRTNLCQFLIFNYHNPYKFNIVKSMWKNNGNALAQLYTGSQALKSDFSKEKKRSLLSRVNDIMISANRMINNKFNDGEKQRVIDLLLKGGNGK
ncbi:SYJ1 [Enterospora canceri]|uniref:SYJ1 n=1 Tax=Enterospora canceri TaxID=1081671 RepID=A0A1Y1S6Q7_9MICR|nr:SYJ1 [Enterospora canceri]